MSLSTAIRKIRAEIARLGEKAYAVEEPASEITPASILQASWNILTLLTISGIREIIFGGPKQEQFSQWCNYIVNPSTYTFNVIDDKTYQLAKVVLTCFDDVTDDFAIKSLISILGQKAEILAGIALQKEGLQSVITAFEENQRLIVTQKARIVAALGSHIEPQLPVLLKLTTATSTLAHRIAYDLGATHGKLNAAKAAFPATIRDIEAYISQLTLYIEEGQAILTEIRAFDDGLIVERDAAIAQLAARSRKTETLLNMARQLLETTRLEEVAIDRALAPQAGEDPRLAKIGHLDGTLETLSSELAAASEGHAQALARFLSIPRPEEVSLDDWQARAAGRRATLSTNIHLLQHYVSEMDKKPHPLPTADDLIAALECVTDKESVGNITRLLTSAQKALDDRAARKSKLGLLKSSALLGHEDTSSRDELRSLIEGKIGQFRAELSITDISIPPTDAIGPVAPNTLFDFQSHYLTRQSWEIQKQRIDALTLSLKQTEMKHKQAALDLLLARLEFNLGNITKEKDGLHEVLTSVRVMTDADEALRLLEENKGDIENITAWFSSESAATTKTNKDLFTELELSFEDIQASYVSFKVLHFSQSQPVPEEFNEKMAALSSKKAEINATYSALSQLKTTLAEQKMARGLEKLRAIEAPIDSVFAETPPRSTFSSAATQDPTGSDDEQQPSTPAMERALEALQALRANPSFFEELGSSTDASPILARLQEKGARLEAQIKQQRESDKLADMIASMDLLNKQQVNTRAEHQQFTQDSEHTLAYIESENSFIEELGSRADNDLAGNASLQAIREQKEALSVKRATSIQIETYHQLKEHFFGSEPDKVGGVFGLYLQERSNTHVVQDFFESCLSYLFSCLGYKSEATKTKDYIKSLKSQADSDHTVDHSALQAGIQSSGITLFSPQRVGNKDSVLLTKLGELRSALNP